MLNFVVVKSREDFETFSKAVSAKAIAPAISDLPIQETFGYTSPLPSQSGSVYLPVYN